MTPNNYTTIYMKLRGIRPVEGYEIGNTRYSNPLDTWGEIKLSSAIRGHFGELFQSLNPFGFNGDQFCNSLMAKFGEYYIEVCPRRLIKLSLGGLKGDTSAMGGISYSWENDHLMISMRLTTIDIDGKTNKTTPTIQIIPAIPANPDNVYVFGDIIMLYVQILNIINRHLSRAVELLNAYKAIPIVNETNSDKTIITPNLTTDSMVKFNPVYTAAESTSSHQITSNKGTQTTITERANGVSAKGQADIVRNLPNIFTDCINQIGALLIDPRTIQDMCDWGLGGGSYIDDTGEVF